MNDAHLVSSSRLSTGLAILLSALLLGSCPAVALAARITIEIDPGEVGEIFATKSFDVPELVGLPALEVSNIFTDEFMELEFHFPDDKFVRTFLYPAGGTFNLSVTYDRPPNLGTSIVSRGSAGGGFGFLVDKEGRRIPASSGASGGGLQPDIDLGIGLDQGRPPFGVERSQPYYGGLFQWGFGEVDPDPQLIVSATLTFLDTRRFVPPTFPTPHLVGSDRIPEPSSGCLAMVGVAVWGSRRWRMW